MVKNLLAVFAFEIYRFVLPDGFIFTWIAFNLKFIFGLKQNNFNNFYFSCAV